MTPYFNLFMTCHKCKNKEQYHGDFCKPCFCELLERRIKKYLRQQEAIKKDDILVVDNDLVVYVLEHILTMPVKIVRDATQEGKKVLAWSMDHELEWFLESLLEKGCVPESHQEGIKLFVTISKKELASYAAAKGIVLSGDLKPKPVRQDLIHISGITSIPGSGVPARADKKIESYADLLNELEKRHHETRPSLLKSIAKLQEILHQE